MKVAPPELTTPALPAQEAPRTLNEAAREFEAILLRRMLGALEKTTSLGEGAPSLYGSMIVDAMADAIVQAGGLGFGAVLEQALAERVKEPE
ncbi:MAG: hypothetical protein DIU78_005690 [Pseudomonadota bacterium]|nr:MAG: hypothetical protein DIU78_12080 [Pseudomonadota bacterium]